MSQQGVKGNQSTGSDKPNEKGLNLVGVNKKNTIDLDLTKAKQTTSSSGAVELDLTKTEKVEK